MAEDNVDAGAPNVHNENFSIMADAINKILNATQRNRDSGGTVGFPCFDPDHSRIDINKWCDDVNVRVKRDNLENYDIIPRVQTALLGRAKLWYDKYGYQHYGWPDLHASLIHAFSSGADVVTQLRTVVNTESMEYNSYTDYVMEKVSQINRLPFEIPDDKIVKIIVGCISENSLRNSLTFAMPTSIQCLVDQLSSIREKPRQKHGPLTHRDVDIAIGDESVLLAERLDVLVEFQELVIEVAFHIIDVEFLNYDVVIGRGVLKDSSISIVADIGDTTLRRCLPVVNAKAYVVESY